MTPKQRISAYNRLQGMLTIVDELIESYHPGASIEASLRSARMELVDAQKNLDWNPCEKATGTCAK